MNQNCMRIVAIVSTLMLHPAGVDQTVAAVGGGPSPTTNARDDHRVKPADRGLDRFSAEAVCEIRLPDGAQEATFQAIPWRTPDNPFTGVLGLVPFELDPTLAPGEACQVEDAIDEIERVSDVQFVPYNPGNPDHQNWIHIQPHPTANNSFIGMIGGQQDINITSWLMTSAGQLYNPCGVAQPQINFIIVHELLHALGFWHEHQRPDRNSFVQINTGVILPASAHNFTINASAQTIGTYDFESVMHYPQWAFSTCWNHSIPPPQLACATIIALAPNQQWQDQMGQRTHLSQSDIDGLCQMYGCAPTNDSCATATTVTNGTTITDNRWATTTAGVGCGGLQRDAWYVYDAPCTGQVTMSIDQASASYTPALAVYGEPCWSGPLVSCDTSMPITASFPVNAGERYRIRVGGTGNSHGTARLQIACAPIACSTGLQWAQTATGNPGARLDHAMAIDSTASPSDIILFGGRDASLNPIGDTWRWNHASQSWTFLTNGGPSARFNHTLTYDAARQRFVLFGGFDGNSWLGDTWEFNPVTNAWQQRFPANSPMARYGHGMTYDAARQRVVLFSGFGSNGSLQQDTWEWDGNNWMLRASGGPPVRFDFGMAYDANRAVSVIWGGNGTADSSVWEWNGTSWIERTTASGPSHRVSHELVFDSASNQVLLFGGWGNGMPQNDLWAWNGTAWTSLGNAGAPPPRFGYAAIFDSTTAYLFVHGGAGQITYGDTWRALVGLTNDDHIGAILVANGMVGFDNRCASGAPGTCAEGRDLWYRYTATSSGSLTVSATGIAGLNFAPRVAIHSAANPFGAPLACGTGSPPVASAIIPAAGDYLIRVGSATADGGIGNLVVNGQVQPCPPVFNLNNTNSYRHRLFYVTGSSSGQPWAWSIQRGNDLMFELNAPGIAPGANAAALAAAFAATINAHSCDTNRLFAVQLNPPHQTKFRVIVGGQTQFNLCMGPAGQLPTCCLPAAGYCSFNPDVREILLSGEDCNANGMDDTIDLLQGDGIDVNENGILDVCEIPPNDSCHEPALINGFGTFAFDNGFASSDGPLLPDCGFSEIDQIERDLWYLWTADAPGSVTLSTCGETTLDTRVAVFILDAAAGACPPMFTVACDDDGCGSPQSEVTWDAVPGQPYMIRLGVFPGSPGGTGSFTISPPPCTGDLNGDGLVNVFDLLQILSAWGECAGCAEDLNGDEVVNVFDLLQVLSAWGECG